MRPEIVDRNKFGNLGPNTLASFEKRIGSALPKAFREFLIGNNGGRPIPNTFSNHGQTETLNGGFYGLHDGPSYSKLDEHYLDFQDRIPPSYLPIASDVWGNQVCIGVSGAEFGKVYFWIHDEPGLPRKIADGFEEFLALFFKDPSDQVSEIEGLIKENKVDEIRKRIENGLDVESMVTEDLTMIELAAMHNRPEVVLVLFEKGAKVRSALQIAMTNDHYFKKHSGVIKTIIRLYNIQNIPKVDFT